MKKRTTYPPPSDAAAWEFNVLPRTTSTYFCDGEPILDSRGVPVGILAARRIADLYGRHVYQKRERAVGSVTIRTIFPTYYRSGEFECGGEL